MMMMSSYTLTLDESVSARLSTVMWFGISPPRVVVGVTTPCRDLTIAATFQLNLSTFCGVLSMKPPDPTLLTKSAEVELRSGGVPSAWCTCLRGACDSMERVIVGGYTMIKQLSPARNTWSSSTSREILAVTNKNSPGTSVNAEYSASRLLVSGSCT